MTSSTILTRSSPISIETMNGRVQLSCNDATAPIGIITERNGDGVGTLLNRDQALNVAREIFAIYGISAPSA